MLCYEAGITVLFCFHVLMEAKLYSVYIQYMCTYIWGWREREREKEGEREVQSLVEYGQKL